MLPLSVNSSDKLVLMRHRHCARNWDTKRSGGYIDIDLAKMQMFSEGDRKINR